MMEMFLTQICDLLEFSYLIFYVLDLLCNFALKATPSPFVEEFLSFKSMNFWLDSEFKCLMRISV